MVLFMLDYVSHGLFESLGRDAVSPEDWGFCSLLLLKSFLTASPGASCHRSRAVSEVPSGSLADFPVGIPAADSLIADFPVGILGSYIRVTVFGCIGWP